MKNVQNCNCCRGKHILYLKKQLDDFKLKKGDILEETRIAKDRTPTKINDLGFILEGEKRIMRCWLKRVRKCLAEVCETVTCCGSF